MQYWKSARESPLYADLALTENRKGSGSQMRVPARLPCLLFSIGTEQRGRIAAPADKPSRTAGLCKSRIFYQNGVA